MASGGMDTLPHTARSSRCWPSPACRTANLSRHFAVTLIKTLAVFVVIGVFYLTGLVWA